MDQALIAELYKKMLLIRRFEEEAARLYTEKKIGGFLHLYIGQEAVAVGATSVLDPEDSIVTSYRCHGLYLARGGSISGGFGELFGKDNGCVRGRGGSMHFFDSEKHFFGGWGIVGAQIPVAAGMAFAHKYSGKDNIAICFMGDGAINIGPFHEGMSLASLWKLPVIYVIENNHFAMGTPLEKTAPTEDLSIRALGYPMARETIDGHDVFAVRAAIHTAAKRAREKKLPTLIEVKTYRYRGHSMADPATYRTKDEVQEWKNRDPITTLAEKLDQLGMESVRQKIEADVDREVQAGLDEAEAAPFPDPSTAQNYSYAHYNY